jgi:hypothetical protein
MHMLHLVIFLTFKMIAYVVLDRNKSIMANVHDLLTFLQIYTLSII